MTFVDITVVPVRHDRKDAYIAFAKRMAEVYLDHGAERVVDYWQSGASTDQHDFHAETSYSAGDLSGLSEISGATESESVVVTVMDWPSREARDRGTASATEDPRVVSTLDEEPVFDGSRVAGDSFEITMNIHRAK